MDQIHSPSRRNSTPASFFYLQYYRKTIYRVDLCLVDFTQTQLPSLLSGRATWVKQESTGTPGTWDTRTAGAWDSRRALWRQHLHPGSPRTGPWRWAACRRGRRLCCRAGWTPPRPPPPCSCCRTCSGQAGSSTGRGTRTDTLPTSAGHREGEDTCQTRVMTNQTSLGLMSREYSVTSFAGIPDRDTSFPRGWLHYEQTGQHQTPDLTQPKGALQKAEGKNQTREHTAGGTVQHPLP